MSLNSLGAPIRAYHGSGCSIDRFEYRFCGQGRDQNGSGFYFSTSLGDAIAYTTATIDGKDKPGGMQCPTVHEVNLYFSQLLEHDEERALTLAQVKALVDFAEDLDSALENWGDVARYGKAAVLARALPCYTIECGDGPLLHALHKVANDFFANDPEGFNRAVNAVLGYDGVIERFDRCEHYVAFFADQIEILDRMTPEEAQSRLEREVHNVHRSRMSQ